MKDMSSKLNDVIRLENTVSTWSESSPVHVRLHTQTTHVVCDFVHRQIIIIIIIIIIYLLKSTEQNDAHMINTRTRAGQERHRKLALTFCPLKKQKNKHRYLFYCFFAE